MSWLFLKRKEFLVTMAVNVAVVGATGAVGEEFLRILEERRFPIKGWRWLPSNRSAGKTM